MTQDEPGKRFERRAFFTLFLILGAHSMTETARDALFLSRVPVAQLPWMYVLVAITSLLVARVTTVFASELRHSLLPVLLLGSAATSCVLWTVANSRSPVFLYILYLWPAVFSSVVVVEFWRILSDAYTITEAKKIFGSLGAAGTAGAAVGSGLAMALSTWLPTSSLLLTAGSLFAIGSLVSPTSPGPRTAPPSALPHLPQLSQIREVGSNRYLRGVIACLFLGTITATLTDFIFKGILTREVSPDKLATTFASVSFGVSVGTLMLQTAMVGPLIRWLGVTRSLVVLPSALSIAAAGLIGGAGLVGAIIVRVTDGTLRYSIHRAISDLLYVPLTPEIRARIKALIDVLSQRFGQVAGSVTILIVWHLGGGYRVLATAVLVLGITAAVMGVRLTQPYLDLFRTTLKKAGTETRLAYPSLDVESLTSLVAAFSSDDERAVVAAMELVAEEHDVQIIPVVMLFHPARAVVLRTLELFEQHQHAGFGWALDRLRHQAEDAQVRAAALSAYVNQQRDEAALRAGLADPDEMVRMTALVGLVSSGLMTGDDATRALSGAATSLSTATRESLATAMRRRPSARFEPTLLLLADTPDLHVRGRVAEAMGRMPSAAFLPALRSMLSESSLRESARQAFLAIGKPALDFLGRSLEDDTLPRSMRLHIPRSISRFEPADAIPVLWGRLLAEPDDLIQFKILRGIGRLAAEAPAARPDPGAIARAIHHISRSGLRFACWRATLRGAAPGQSRSDTEAVLIQLVSDKQARATESMFRLLGLSKPTEDFERIYRGLQGNRIDRASSRELLESAVHPPAREVVLALLDDSADSALLARLAAPDVPLDLSYHETLAAIVRASTGALRSVAAQHAADLAVA